MTDDWPAGPCPPVSLQLRAILCRLERLALTLDEQQRGDLEMWLRRWLEDAEARPVLLVLGAGVLATSAGALAKRQDLREARCVAHHEAGHVVMAVLCEIPVRRVTIDASPVDGFLGCCWLGDVRDSLDSARVEAESAALVSLAGPIAEGIAGFLPNARNLEAHHRDALEDVRHAGPMNGTAELEAHVAYLHQRAMGMLLHYWPAVTALAAELLLARTLTGGEAEALVIDALRRGDLVPDWLAWRVEA